MLLCDKTRILSLTDFDAGNVAQVFYQRYATENISVPGTLKSSAGVLAFAARAPIAKIVMNATTRPRFQCSVRTRAMRARRSDKRGSLFGRVECGV